MTRSFADNDCDAPHDWKIVMPINKRDMAEEDPGSESKPFFEGRLTKSVLLSLPEGLLIQSNCGPGPLNLFEERLGPLDRREEVWGRLRQLRLDGRLFRGFSNEESYDRLFLDRLKCLEPSDLDS